MFKTVVEVATLTASFVVQHFLYRRSLPATFTPRRILVIKLDHLGDVLLATPVFSNLRRAYPSAQVHALVGEWGAAGLKDHPHVDRIFGFFHDLEKQSLNLKRSPSYILSIVKNTIWWLIYVEIGLRWFLPFSSQAAIA